MPQAGPTPAALWPCVLKRVVAFPAFAQERTLHGSQNFSRHRVRRRLRRLASPLGNARRQRSSSAQANGRGPARQPVWRSRGHFPPGSRYGLRQLLSFARRLYQRLHGGDCEPVWRIDGQVFAGCDHGGSGWTAAAGMELSARAFDHWAGASGDTRGADRRAAAGLGLCEIAGHTAGADALRLHS